MLKRLPVKLIHGLDRTKAMPTSAPAAPQPIPFHPSGWSQQTKPRLVFLFGKRNCAERHGDVFLTQTHESAHVQHHGVDRTVENSMSATVPTRFSAVSYTGCLYHAETKDP